MIATGLIAGSLYSSELKAQTPVDTAWATGIFKVKKKNSNIYISTYLEMYMIPLNVQMSNPDTIKDNMSGLGMYAFNLPIHIDTTVGINQPTHSLESKVFPTVSGGDLNIFLKEQADQGLITLYSVSGQKVKQKEFQGDNAYLSYPELANGTYIYTIETEDGATSGKIIKTRSESLGPSARPNMNNNSQNNNPNARFAGTYSADYKILLVDTAENYFPLDTTITLTDGDNGLINLWMTHKPESVIDLKVNAWHALDSTLEANAFVYIKDSQGNIDSLRTDSTGTGTFENVSQNKTYTFGIGKEGFLAWDNITHTTPTSNTLNDTITEEVNYSLIPDQKYSRKGQITIPVSVVELDDLFLAYNIQMSKGDTLRFHLGPGYSPTQIANANQWLANYSAWTGVPTKIEANAFAFPVPTSFDPDTSDLSILGTNVTYGTSNCTPDYFLHNGNLYTSSATMTNSFYSEKSFHKEVGRIFLDEASGVMLPNPTNMTTSNSAHIEIIYEVGKRHFEGKHDPVNMQKLTNTSTIIPN